ncbi:MAG: hypothetical protein ACRD0K_21725 [Egibacteraceae bacterium]
MTADGAEGGSSVSSPPGSPAAVRAGCLCPVLDNSHGRGLLSLDGETVYWVSGDCRLHGLREWAGAADG